MGAMVSILNKVTEKLLKKMFLVVVKLVVRGTRKTVVALHRTKHLLKKHDYNNNVGLFTFSRVFVTDLKRKN